MAKKDSESTQHKGMNYVEIARSPSLVMIAVVEFELGLAANIDKISVIVVVSSGRSTK